MERLEKLINILKLTPHRQPELVKEASHRILARPTRLDPQISYFLKPLIEILIQYCDSDDSAQRSLFNDYLNSVILAFQNINYSLIFQVLLDEIINNGSARTVTAALQRIPHLINNVKPIELGCEPQKLLKALIEVSRRAKDESVQKALDSALRVIMPYLEYNIRKSKEIQLLSNSLTEKLLHNLENDSSQTRRLAASSLSTICLNSDFHLQNTLVKLNAQLEILSTDTSQRTKFVGFCLCVKEIPELAKRQHIAIIKMILKQIQSNLNDLTLITASLETLRDLFKFHVGAEIIAECVETFEKKFLFSELNGEKVIKQDIKVILQANALACISSIVKQNPTILDQLEPIFLFKNHPETAIRNQTISIIGNYIEASWRFPSCVDQSVGCERIRKLWVELRSILHDDYIHPDNLKSCVVAIKTCMSTLTESDHCVHIVEYSDIDHLIYLYNKSNFKPFKIEVLSLFASINYRTLHYLERSHWSKMKTKIVCSFTDSLQNRIVSTMIASVIDEHQRVRNAATAALIAIIPNLYVTNLSDGQKSVFHKSSDPIVSLAQDLSDEHLPVLLQADEHLNHFNGSDEPVESSELHDKLCIWNDHKFLTSSIVQLYDNPYNELTKTKIDETKSRHRVNISLNLMYVVGLLRNRIEDSLDRGKTAISSIVCTLHELSLVYPIHQYSSSWDCRPSEYCECSTLLNFLLTYLENLNEPDVIVEDLEAYKNFLAFSRQLLYALCHESVSNDYNHQKMKPFHKRQANLKEGYWSELSVKHPSIAETLDTFFTHLVKLLWLMSYIIEERNNQSNIISKQAQSQQQKGSTQEPILSHSMLVSNRLLFGRLHKKLESSFKSSKKNLNQQDEKFYQILETCLESTSSLLEFIGMSRSIENVKDVLGYLKITFPYCSISSLICARQLLKSLFGINILALYQVDPYDWFEEESWYQSSPSNLITKYEDQAESLQGVYHYLLANPYKIFSGYYMMNCSITRKSDKAQAILNFESRRALKVRRRIEERVKSLFEHSPHQLISPKVRQISEILKSTITEFTPIVIDCMNQFNSKGFCKFQNEILHFMSYLILLRVNYQKLALAGDLISSINKLMDQCGEKVFSQRETGIELFLRNSFTFLTFLSYERGPSKPMFQVATVIQRLDDMRAKLSMTPATEGDITTYIVPLLRCLVEDLFIYRTKQFQNVLEDRVKSSAGDSSNSHDKIDQLKSDSNDTLEAERETVAQKLIDVVDSPRVYDLLSILILESRQNPCEIKFKKLSQQLLPIVSTMLSKRTINLVDYASIELTRRIIENISPEVFQPIKFIFEILLEAPKPSSNEENQSKQEFQRWMSQAIISLHILVHHVKEDVFLSRLRETMSDVDFVEYLLHIAQLCVAEILIHMHKSSSGTHNATIVFLAQQLSCYLLYLTHIFQSASFFLISRCAQDLIRRLLRESKTLNKSFKDLCFWAREPNNSFNLDACEVMFYYLKLTYPDLTIFWCNIMMLLNNVDCNREYWRNLLVYECHHCQTYERTCAKIPPPSPTNDDTTLESIVDQGEDGSGFKRPHINRPSSLNLSDVSFSDQLRRSFIKRIAAAETRDKALNRNIIETSDEDGKLLEREVNIGNTEQCLAPNIEITRRGTLCLVLDFVTISMNDVEHITWLIIHHINDIIRWSHEMPIKEFINAVHGNSASSGIFIQAINSGFNNLNSISFVTRLLWTLEQVHYTQYGSLVVLLVEKLLSSPELMPYRALTKRIEEFACSTVQKLLNETNKCLVTTNDEVVNQLTSDDLDRIYSMLDVKLYPTLSNLLLELQKSSQEQVGTPTIEFHAPDNESDEDSEKDELEVLYIKSNLILWLTEQNCSIQVSSLISAINTIKSLLFNPTVALQVNKDDYSVCLLVSAIYSVALNILPPPTRLIRPKFWSNLDEESNFLTKGDKSGNFFSKPIMIFGAKRTIPSLAQKRDFVVPKKREEQTEEEAIEAARTTCLRGLFLLENIEYLRTTQFGYLDDLIILLARLPLINSFVLTPPVLWRQNIWPIEFNLDDNYKTHFPIVTHDILSKDKFYLENFCDRLLKLGWISRRQFEEAWMTLLGVLSTSFSQTNESKDNNSGLLDSDRKVNLLMSCKVVATITKLLTLTRRSIMGNPLSPEPCLNQGFDEKVIELTKAIGSNMSSLRKKTKAIFDSLDLERRPHTKIFDSINSSKLTLTGESQSTNFSDHLKISAQKLRMNSILNVEVDMQETVVVDNEEESRSDEVDVESCIRLLLSIYKQKFKEPNENFVSPSPLDQTSSQQHQRQKSSSKNRSNQLAPPLATAICQSVLALSDLLADYEQFDWMFETFVQMFKLAERNEDEIQMQYLILGLCKSATICCYEIPNELTTSATINHKDVMFEKCRQCIEKCIKSEFGPLKLEALFGVYYMLEDSVNIVASGAWELDHFRQLRHSRLTWILKLMPIILDKENSKLLTKKPQIVKLLEVLCETVSESELKAIRG